MSEIIKQIKDNKLSDIFYLDALIISCANGQPNKKQAEFLAELGDVLGFDQKNTEVMCILALSIIEQDFERIKKLCYNISDNEITIKSMCYINPIIENKVMSDDSILYYFSLYKAKSPLFSSSKEIKGYKKVIFENQLINNQLIFNSVSTVIFKKCIFTDYINDVLLQFNEVYDIYIEECLFENMKACIYISNNCAKLNMCDSLFQNVDNSRGLTRLNSLREPYGSAIITSDNFTSVSIERCRFINIKALHDCGAITYYNKVKANNCEFTNCSGYSMFFRNHYGGGSFSGDNNQFIGCCKTYDKEF